jgi:hypothetical protein
MKRREFITLLGGGAAAWPLAARAQQRDPVKRLGVLWGLAENDNVYEPYLSVFKQRLQDLGWIDGRNVRVEYRFTGVVAERIRIAARAGCDFRDNQSSSGGSIAGDADHSDCLYARLRFGRKRLRSELGASSRKHYGVPQF